MHGLELETIGYLLAYSAFFFLGFFGISFLFLKYNFSMIIGQLSSVDLSSNMTAAHHLNRFEQRLRDDVSGNG